MSNDSEEFVKYVEDAIRTRRSIREFTGESIPDEDIERILDAARYAPSPENMQMWRYVVIRDDQELKTFIGELAQETARIAFGGTPFEATSGRLWYLPDHRRPATYEIMRDGSLFRYPEKADTVIVCCGSEGWHDSHFQYPNWLFGSVVTAMGIMNMWLMAHVMGYGVGYEALPLSDPRHMYQICDRLGIPRTWDPISCLAIGVPIQKRMLGPSRWPLEGVMYSERWGNPYRRIAFRDEKD